MKSEVLTTTGQDQEPFEFNFYREDIETFEHLKRNLVSDLGKETGKGTRKLKQFSTKTP